MNSIVMTARNNTVDTGAAEGGVWKRTDGESLEAAYRRSAVAGHGRYRDRPSHPDRFMRPREENFSYDSYYGAGILKSTDAARLTNIVGPFLQTSRWLAVHPTSGQILLASANSNSNEARVSGDPATALPLGRVSWPAPARRAGPTNGNIAYTAIGAVGGNPATDLSLHPCGETRQPIMGSGANALPAKMRAGSTLRFSLHSLHALFAIATSTSSAPGQQRNQHQEKAAGNIQEHRKRRH